LRRRRCDQRLLSRHRDRVLGGIQAPLERGIKRGAKWRGQTRPTRAQAPVRGASGARIGDSLNLRGALLSNPGAVAPGGYRLTVEGVMFCDEGGSPRQDRVRNAVLGPMDGAGLSGLAGTGTFRGCIRRTLRANDVYRRRTWAHRKVVGSHGRQRQRQGDPTPCHFQRIAHRGACGKGRVGPQNRRPDQERTKVRLRMRVCAPPDWPGGRQREMRTGRTRGSKLRETPVIRPAGARHRSTAAPEVSR